MAKKKAIRVKPAPTPKKKAPQDLTGYALRGIRAQVERVMAQVAKLAEQIAYLEQHAKLDHVGRTRRESRTPR